MDHYQEFIARVTLAFMNLREERGQTMVEYALLVAVIALVVVVAAATLGVDINGLFGKASTQLNSVR